MNKLTSFHLQMTHRQLKQCRKATESIPPNQIFGCLAIQPVGYSREIQVAVYSERATDRLAKLIKKFNQEDRKPSKGKGTRK